MENVVKDGFSVSVATNVGNCRERNEDNFFADGIGVKTAENAAYKANISGTRGVFAVFDGMGGESFGQESSALAANALLGLRDSFNGADVISPTNDLVKVANERICAMIKQNGARCGGTTLALVILDEEMVYAYSLGDSRIYYYRDGFLSQISEDQTLAMKKIKANVYTEEEAKNSPDSHAIYAFLGVDTELRGLLPQVYPAFNINKGKLLISSDGLTDCCSDIEIAEILSSPSDNYADALCRCALKNGGTDNVTCIVIEKK